MLCIADIFFLKTMTLCGWQISMGKSVIVGVAVLHSFID
jgi:hypothetical protein